jgi:hypothetical protein
MQMVAQHEATIPLLQSIGGRRLRRVPVVRRIVFAQLDRRWLRIETDQPAIAALDDFEKFVCRAIQPVGRRKQRLDFTVAARRTRQFRT